MLVEMNGLSIMLIVKLVIELWMEAKMLVVLVHSLLCEYIFVVGHAFVHREVVSWTTMHLRIVLHSRVIVARIVVDWVRMTTNRVVLLMFCRLIVMRVLMMLFRVLRLMMASLVMSSLMVLNWIQFIIVILLMISVITVLHYRFFIRMIVIYMSLSIYVLCGLLNILNRWTI